MTKKDDKNDKYTLLELIEKSEANNSVLMGVLAENKLLDKYEEELTAIERGMPITASLSEDEFKKMFDKFLKKKV